MKNIIFLLLISVLLFFSCRETVPPGPIEVAGSNSISCAPPTVDAQWYTTNRKAPLFGGMDLVNFPISTRNEAAQRYFNQGLALSFGFNHAEAARSFYYATQLDPECALCFWGFAYVLGPNYNAGMEADHYQKAYKAIQKALQLQHQATAKEKALIQALAKRYVAQAIEDRRPLDIAYSEAMKAVSLSYPEDETIQVLYGESLLNLHPWDLYDKQGTAKEWTPEIVSLFEKILQKNPKHIGAHHFYIHAVEASKTPQRANASAQFFDAGNAKSLGHLVHMSSHIYIRTGAYHKGTLANINAVKVDSTYVTMCHAQGAYPLAYYPHNYHFMAATATLEGNSKWALIGANATSRQVHPQTMVTPGWSTLQHYYVIPYFVAVKFGRWDAILKMKLVNDTLKYPLAISHYARGMAYLGKKNIKMAKAASDQLAVLAQDQSLSKMTIWNINSMSDIVQIAAHVLQAEILASEGHYPSSIKLLQKAVAIEDGLNYNEPPDWFFSVRHHLGAVQIEAGRYNDAIKTYEADLKKFPLNGWAQHGLQLAYVKSNNPAKVKSLEKLIASSWATADVTLTSSRIK